MEDDDYPNFGNAYPTQGSTPSTDEQVSWNPALRPNTHHRRDESRATNVDDDFFDRYPGPTPEKRRGLPSEQEMEHKSVTQTNIGREDEQPDPVDTDIERVDESTELSHAKLSVEDSPSDAPVEEEPSTHYEHQGGVTELEDAIDESVQAPLIKDEQPLPTVATISREPTFAPEYESNPIKSIERSFTTNFTDVTSSAKPAQEEIEVSSDWPAVGDDKTFADLLDGQDTKHTSGDHKAAHEDSAAIGEEDINAAWAAALSDDDILEDTNELDPASLFGDGGDDDGFLDDEAPSIAPSNQPIQQQRSVSAYLPDTARTSASQNPFEAPSSPFISQTHGRSGGTPTTGLFDLYSQPAVIPSQTQPARPALQTTQSFVDRPTGYQSPYDLPMDVVKTRRRPVAPSTNSQAVMPTLPPRTSSFHVSSGSMQGQTANPSPPTSSHGINGSAASSAKSTPKPDAGFFADLPMTTKPRARPSGTYTQQPTPPLAPTQQLPAHQPLPSHAPPLRTSQSYAPPQQQQQQQAAIVGGLRQPDKVPLFPDQTTPPSTMQSQLTHSPPAPSQASTRYSPAPQSIPQVAGSTARYSPAPPGGQPMKSAQRYSSSPSAVPSLPPARAAQSFVPRTSSPLAVHGRPQMQTEPSSEQLRSTSQIIGSPGKSYDTGINAERRASGTSRYAPSNASSANEAETFSPRRPRTQSPSEFRKLPTITPITATSMLAPTHLVSQAPGSMHLAHKRQFSRDLPFATPNDERIHDPLERWKGHPIFYWSPTGMLTTSFPRHTPFYASGVNGASVKCTPGDVKIVDASTILPLSERDAKFPGPLTARSKGKKRDLVSWLNGKVEELQQAVEAARLNFDLPEEIRRGSQEKLLLWQIMQLYLEHDGMLEGSPKIEEQVRQLLIPDLAQKAQIVELQSPISVSAASDTVDKAVIRQIRQALLEGQREKAVWLAEEKRLWGHAMLIASTMGSEIFKQIVASFVRSQIKSQGGSELKSLAALYQVFAGSPEECVDELVPPSARAGFQMINTMDGRGTADSLSGLDQWRETLSLVHSNPTPGNSASLLAVGKLLAGYGRTEAAHICYLFARSLAKHAGADDPEAQFILLGTDVTNGTVDLDSLMLTEIYEYATSLSAPSTAVQYIPHLQSYKLVHARYLAASGHKAQAQSYCEHVDAAIRSTTRPSGYYHQAFAQELMSFNALLSQTPHSGAQAGKFFSRPAIDKVSSNMGSWFTKFVSGGEESENDSTISGHVVNEAESFGPFGGVSGSSGPISRTPSSAELYSATTLSPPLSQPFQPASLPTRYPPASQSSTNKYTPAAAPQFAATRSSFESDRSVAAPSSTMPYNEPARSTSSRYAPMSAGQSPSLLAIQPPAISRRASNQSLASTGSYEPKPLLAEQDGFGYASPPVEQEEAQAATEYAGSAGQEETSDHAFEAGNFGGYAPPTMAYEPPSYQPYAAETEANAEDESTKPKKKSFMDDDDDDDIARRAAQLKATPASREPDPAIVAAAAADAARQAKGHGSKESGSWFGGWFGKKDPNAAPGPIKAKLGEESSFYFDKDLNKWVNKKGGADSASASAPTPPPPKAGPGPGGSSSGPPSRVASGSAGGPPASGPPSRQATPANGLPGTALPPKMSSTPALAGSVAGAMAPPPRPASSMSNASSLDDLLGGPPGANKKGTVKSKKKGRYVDVMANAG